MSEASMEMDLAQVLMWLGISIGIGVIVILILWLIRWWAQGAKFSKNVRMTGKTIIITGANSSIGIEIAIDLAARGAKIYMACRDQKRAEEARQRIIRTTGNSNIVFIPCDLASLSSVRSFAYEFLRLETRLDVLILNAGVNVMFMPIRTESKDGFEMHLAINLGHFLLTNLLLDTLKASMPSRVITVSSAAHRYGRINRLDLNMEKSYNQYQAYFQGQLFKILFSRALAKRLLASGVTSNSLHPGIIRTVGDVRRCVPLMDIFIAPLVLFMKTAKSGAQTAIALAVDPELEQVNGKYFAECRIADESESAKDDETAEWLWKMSEILTGLNEQV